MHRKTSHLHAALSPRLSRPAVQSTLSDPSPSSNMDLLSSGQGVGEAPWCTEVDPLEANFSPPCLPCPLTTVDDGSFAQTQNSGMDWCLKDETTTSRKQYGEGTPGLVQTRHPGRSSSKYPYSNHVWRGINEVPLLSRSDADGESNTNITKQLENQQSNLEWKSRSAQTLRLMAYPSDDKNCPPEDRYLADSRANSNLGTLMSEYEEFWNGILQGFYNRLPLSETIAVRSRVSDKRTASQAFRHEATRYSSSTSRTRSQCQPNKERRMRQKGDKEDEDDNNSSHSSSSSTTRGDDRRLLACPYFKYNPARYSEMNSSEKDYRSCSNKYLPTIARLK